MSAMAAMVSPTRDKALRILEECHAANAELFDRLSDEQLTASGTIGNGNWSAKDLMGHIAAWERYAIEAKDAFDRGEKLWIDTVSADKGGVDRLNDEAIARDAQLPLSEVRTASEATFAALLGVIRSMTDDDWKRKYDAGDDNIEAIGAILGGITGASPPDGPFAHVAAHIESLRSYVDSVSS
jgi:uncharacterized damage-inducible protein DinB